MKIKEIRFMSLCNFICIEVFKIKINMYINP
nr:MAG TPA: hypothetical protein [Caudoviricetes sp.]